MPKLRKLKMRLANLMMIGGVVLCLRVVPGLWRR